MDRRIISRAVLIFSLLIVGLFIFPAPETNAEIYGTISGKVIAEDTGEGVRAAYVYVMAARGFVIGNALTNKNGVYVIEDLKPGKYEIYFAKIDSMYIEGAETGLCMSQLSYFYF